MQWHKVKALSSGAPAAAAAAGDAGGASQGGAVGRSVVSSQGHVCQSGVAENDPCIDALSHTADLLLEPCSCSETCQDWITACLMSCCKGEPAIHVCTADKTCL